MKGWIPVAQAPGGRGLAAWLVSWLAIAFASVSFATDTGSSAGGNARSDRNDHAAEEQPLPSRWTGYHVDEPVFGSSMFVVEAGPGDGPVMLLVHGLGQNGFRDWWEVMEALENDYRLVAIDLPGFGRSPGAEGELLPRRYSQLLAWLTEELELEDIHLVGHSMGAAIALYHADEFPGRISDVVLVDTAGVLQRASFVRQSTTSSIDTSALPGRLGDRVRRLLDWGGSMVERLAMLPDFIEVLRQSDRAWNALLADHPNTNAALSLIDTDFSAAIAGLDRPTTVIWGARDTVAPIRVGHLLHGRLATVRMNVIDEAAHVPMKTHTDEFMAHLRAALDHPPDGPRPPPPRDDDPKDYQCRDRSGETISGSYGSILIEGCTNVRLVDVTANRIRIERSIAELVHVDVDAREAGITIVDSTVAATDLRVRGEPALRIDGSRLDLAGSTIRSAGDGLRVMRESSVIVSVSDIHSARYRGRLHGSARAAETVLDDAEPIRSTLR